jgi:hypothetical protein
VIQKKHSVEGADTVNLGQSPGSEEREVQERRDNKEPDGRVEEP